MSVILETTATTHRIKKQQERERDGGRKGVMEGGRVGGIKASREGGRERGKVRWGGVCVRTKWFENKRG